MAHAEGQQHPLGVYFKVWGWLFVLSLCSYMVDILEVQSYLRWTLIITFMLMKAGLIMAVFMHMQWERLALVYAVIMPPAVLLVSFIAIMTIESDWTYAVRGVFFGATQAAGVH